MLWQNRDFLRKVTELLSQTIQYCLLASRPCNTQKSVTFLISSRVLQDIFSIWQTMAGPDVRRIRTEVMCVQITLTLFVIFE